MEARVSRGLLEVQDDRGSYRIPVGRRARKCLIVLEKVEGEYVRSLELDLFTGFVYYCVDNLTSGGLSYYYDMSSKKVGHYFIHRYLRLAAVRGFGASPEEMDVFEKLPCGNWVEEMEKLPGWKEAIEHRVERLLLPGKKAVQIGIPQAGVSQQDAAKPDRLSEGGHESEKKVSDSSAYGEGTIIFSRFPEAYPSQARKYVFQFVKRGEGYALRHLDENIGGEFFGENEEYELFLTEAEYAWILELVKELFGRGEKEKASGSAAVKPLVSQIIPAEKSVPGQPSVESSVPGQPPARPADAGQPSAGQSLEEILSDGAGMATKETEVRFAGMDFTETKAQKPANILFNLLRGLLRREIELTQPVFSGRGSSGK